MAPDEIIIVQRKDNETAENAQELLEKRLEYKQESGQLYLTEYQPILQAGIVQRDGLTGSLIVSGQVEEILLVYDGLGQPGGFPPLKGHLSDQFGRQIEIKI